MALAEEHAADFATRAAEHDREGSFPVENFEAMKKSGFLAGPVPEEFGGLGLFSIHDIGVALSRLARGDASTAIAANMHLTSVWTMHRLLRAGAGGRQRAAAAILEGLLKGIGARADRRRGARYGGGDDGALSEDGGRWRPAAGSC